MNLTTSHSELFRSCQILFGSELQVSGEFLDYLEVGGVKSAYRKRAMETHPDRQSDKDPLVQRENTALFSSVRDAYENLLGLLRDKETLQSPPESRRTSATTATAPSGDRPDVDDPAHSRQRSCPTPRRPIKPIMLSNDNYQGSGSSNTVRYYEGSLPGRQLSKHCLRVRRRRHPLPGQRRGRHQRNTCAARPGAHPFHCPARDPGGQALPGPGVRRTAMQLEGAAG